MSDHRLAAHSTRSRAGCIVRLVTEAYVPTRASGDTVTLREDTLIDALDLARIYAGAARASPKPP